MQSTIGAKIRRAIKESAIRRVGLRVERIDRDQQEGDLVAFFHETAPVSVSRKLIRLGNANDGGYLVPDDLVGIRTCFSPGVSDIADFELDLTKRNIKCYLADFSVESPPIQNPLFAFEKKFLGGQDNSVYMTLASWVERNAPPEDCDLILQMDIEGAEYDVLIDTPLELLQRFRIVLIEFHSMDALLSPMGFRLINGVFKKLLKAFRIVHIHPNNIVEPVRYRQYAIPPLMEFTFLRNDRVTNPVPTKTFPHELDRPNLPQKSDFPLPSCWYDNASQKGSTV